VFKKTPAAEVKMNADPIVAEVHAIRAKLAKQCDYDIAKMTARHRQIFRAWKGKKVTRPFHPAWHPPHAAAVAEGRALYATGKGRGA